MATKKKKKVTKKKAVKKKTVKKKKVARRRTNDIDISQIEAELDLNPIQTETSAAIEEQWNTLNAQIDERLASLEDDDPREYTRKVAKESLKDAFRFLTYVRQELELGSRSAMMFQSVAHILTSISNTVEKLNGIILGQEKNTYQDKKLALDMMRVKMEGEKLKLAKQRALNPGQMPGMIRADNVLIMTREEALKKSEDEVIDADFDEEIKQLEGEILGGESVCDSDNKTPSD